MKKYDLAWVAGLLEGEGCFGTKGKAGTARNIAIYCAMTDEDVIRRLHHLIGYGAVLGPYKTGFRKDGSTCKPRFIFQVSGQPAYSLMHELLPLMGARRAAKIRLLIKRFESVETKVFRIQHLISGRIEETVDLTSWLKRRAMLDSNLWRTLNGERSHHKGWRRLT